MFPFDILFLCHLSILTLCPHSVLSLSLYLSHLQSFNFFPVTWILPNPVIFLLKYRKLILITQLQYNYKISRNHSFVKFYKSFYYSVKFFWRLFSVRIYSKVLFNFVCLIMYLSTKKSWNNCRYYNSPDGNCYYHRTIFEFFLKEIFGLLLFFVDIISLQTFILL